MSNLPSAILVHFGYDNFFKNPLTPVPPAKRTVLQITKKSIDRGK